MEAKRLDEAIKEIIESIDNTLKSATGNGKPLKDIKEVVKGERHKTKPSVPALWIFTETATIEHASALVEQWTLPVIISAIVKENDPGAGYEKAGEYAAKARSEVLSDRTLGLREFVQDVQSNRFEAGGPWLREGTLFAANAVISVMFRIKEN